MSKDINLAPVVFLGDSHVQYIKVATHHHLLAPRTVTGCEVGGATAIGMRNPNAMTNALAQFRLHIKPLDRRAIIIIHLGEVDCGYVIWYRSKKYNESPMHQLEQSIDAHIAFVDEVLQCGFSRVILTSATLPTISDFDQDGEVVKKRSGINASQLERTRLTLIYNEKLRKAAAIRGLRFADITPDVIDVNTGLVHEKFRNTNPLDHHMDYGRAATVWAKNLIECINFYDPPKVQHISLEATATSYIKALALHSQQMASDMKISVNIGDNLEALCDAIVGEFLVVRNIRLNGRVIEPTFRLIHRDHWKLTGKSEASANLPFPVAMT